MNVVERHTSPDGLFDLIVTNEHGDWSVGFDGYAWHTHGDILYAWGYCGTPDEAVRQFVDDVLACRWVIVISRIDGRIDAIWVTDDPQRDEAKYASPNETIEKRFWDGSDIEARMRLDEYSQCVADELLREFPELKGSIRPPYTAGRLCLHHHSPHADTFLYVSTEDDEITIGLGHWWHTHIDAWDVDEDQQDAEEIRLAIELIREILQDELVILAKHRNGQWTGSCERYEEYDYTLNKGEELTVTRWKNVTTFRPGDEIRID